MTQRWASASGFFSSTRGRNFIFFLTNHFKSQHLCRTSMSSGLQPDCHSQSNYKLYLPHVKQMLNSWMLWEKKFGSQLPKYSGAFEYLSHSASRSLPLSLSLSLSLSLFLLSFSSRFLFLFPFSLSFFLSFLFFSFPLSLPLYLSFSLLATPPLSLSFSVSLSVLITTISG